MKEKQISIVIASSSDLQYIKNTTDVLKDFRMEYELQLLSAHRTPKKVAEFAQGARGRGIRVIIAASSGSAHLAGAIAAYSNLPIIGIPIPTKYLDGMDSLLSTVQMPTGVPVASVGIGEAGAKNAALLAIQILAISDSTLTKKLGNFKEIIEEKVFRDNRNLEL